MTAVNRSVRLNADDLETAQRAAQPGTAEHDALREIVGHEPESSASGTDGPQAVVNAVIDAIQEKVMTTGYAKAAADRTCEDRAYARAARQRSARVASARA